MRDDPENICEGDYHISPLNNIVFVSRKQTVGIRRALRVDFTGKCFIMQHYIIKNTSYHFVNHLRSFIVTGA